MEKQPSSRTCFLCGRQNPIGLKMSWYNDRQTGQVRATVTVPEPFNGYPGIVHGGIVAAILDETAGRALLLEGGDENLMVTLTLKVRYRRPTPTGQPLTAVGWVVRQTPLRAKVAAELRLADGTVTAEAEVLLARPGEEFVRLWEPEKPYWRVYED
ncbi:MAG: PaaI family thioesterase [Anaerolineae bacterium]